VLPDRRCNFDGLKTLIRENGSMQLTHVRIMVDYRTMPT